MYEFRFYAVSHGRMAPELALIYDMAINGAPAEPGGPPAYKESLWERYGVPRPVGVWTVASGQRMPGLLYIIPWQSMTERDAIFPRFWTDPFWRARRAEATQGSPLVESIETWLMSPSSAWVAARGAGSAAPVGGLHELRIHRVYNGHVDQAAAAWGDIELPLLQQHGGQLLGAFDVVIGPDRPALVTLLAWPNMATHQAAWASFDADPQIAAQRQREVETFGRPLYSRVEQYLLDPLPWCTPLANFGAKQ